MAVDDVSNDTRGWIMCIVSGIACVAGASVIYVDLLISKFPNMQHFRIQDSNGFQASALSLSFGVMIYSSLYSMLPESKEYLKKDGWHDSDAGLVMMACFVGGFIGIQVISRVMHRFMPHHVVDCDHSHAHDHDDDLDDPKLSDSRSHPGSRQHSRVGRPKLRAQSSGRRITTVVKPHLNGHANGHTPHHHHHHHHQTGEITEHTPLLGPPANGRPRADHGSGDTSAVGDSTDSPGLWASERKLSRRPSLAVVRDTIVSFVKDTPKASCDGDGSCFGFSDPCGQECFKHISSRNSASRQNSATGQSRTRPSYWTPTTPRFEGGIPEVNSEDGSGTRSPLSPAPGPPREVVHHDHGNSDSEDEGDHAHDHMHDDDLEAQEFGHHHHVPENAFLAIGFQTVIAIALHKFPEGFITYASNHANPKLGFNVFMALFVHNITEGFAMALPLYMALGSRLKAVGVATVLGGFTQPLGAAIGWFVINWFGPSPGDGGEGLGINHTVYAVLFATTAGIMASVALQLFVESLSLNHNRNLSIFFAFLGMVLLGVSGAVAGHSH
ncbi:unnamed protein product [Discula destructiva]